MRLDPKSKGVPFFLRGDLVAGSQQVRLNSLQGLMGYMQHWLVAPVLWTSCVQPVDFLLGYANEAETFISCANRQIWVGLWDMLSLRQLLAKDELDWPTPFSNNLPGAISLHRRFPWPRAMGELRWLTTDANLDLVGILDWASRKYLRLSPDYSVDSFGSNSATRFNISDKELMVWY